jgi:hypothetical protein
MKVKRYCVDCGKELGDKNKSGLCKSCYGKSLTGKNNPMFGHIGKTNPNYKDGRTLTQHYCIDCGCKINWQQATYRSGLCLCCSRKGNRNPNFRHGNFKCKICNKEFTYRESVTGICRLCAIGKNHWSYIHGQYKAPYSIEFTKRLKLKIRTRDNFECQCCGLKENKSNRNLDVHHIDYNKQNCKEDNLIATCGNCNRKANYNRDYWFAYYTYLMENR